MLRVPTSETLRAVAAVPALVTLLVGVAASPGVSSAAEMAPAAVEEQAAQPAQEPPAQQEKPPAQSEQSPAASPDDAAFTPPPDDPNAGRGIGVYRPKRHEVELPPGAEWLTDERGFRYFLKEIPKTERWQMFDETRVRVRSTEVYELADETEDALVVKVYEQRIGVPSGDFRPPTPEEIEAVRKSYEVRITESDRVRFRSFGDGLPKSGQWRNGFDIADMNGDGHLDIVHPPARKGGNASPVIILGDGEGHWRLWEEVRFPPLGYSYGDAAVADFNGDGHPDVAFGQHLIGVTVVIGDGKGRFTPWNKGLPWELPGGGNAALGFSSRQVEVADWNGDGRPDVLALGEGPRPALEGPYKALGILPSSSFGVAVFLNQGDGSWKRIDQGLKFGQIFGDHLLVADFDRDGRLDFLASSNSFGRTDLLGLAAEDGNWSHTKIEPVRERSFVRSIAAADFDGDGRLDLAVGTVSSRVDSWWTAIDVLLAREDGWERRMLQGAEGREWASALGAGDLDGDGHADLAAISDEGKTWIFLGAGDGTFTREESAEIPDMDGGCTGYSLELADLDGDGRDEFVTGFAGEPSAMFAPDRCPSRGALRAWDVEPSEPADQRAGAR